MNIHAGQALRDLQTAERERATELFENLQTGKFKAQSTQMPVADSYDAADVRARVLAATLHAVASGPNGQPLTTTNAAVSGLMNLDAELDARIEDFYTGPGRRFLPLHLLYGADGDGAHSVRAIVARAVGAYDAHFRNGGGDVNARISDVVAVATSRPEQSWRITGARTIEVVTELIAEDLHCDFDIFAGTDYGSCVDRLGRVADLYGKSHADSKRKYVAENFSTVPFRCGNLYILARICKGCYATFLKQNHIDTDKVEIVEPWSDGFGSVATKS